MKNKKKYDSTTIWLYISILFFFLFLAIIGILNDNLLSICAVFFICYLIVPSFDEFGCKAYFATREERNRIIEEKYKKKNNEIDEKNMHLDHGNYDDYIIAKEPSFEEKMKKSQNTINNEVEKQKTSINRLAVIDKRLKEIAQEEKQNKKIEIMDNNDTVKKQNFNETNIIYLSVLTVIIILTGLILSNIISTVICGLCLLAIIITISSSFHIIEANEIGLMIKFGKPMFQIGPGLIWNPFPFMWKITKETSLIIEENFPDENKGSLPIHVTHGKSKELNTALSTIMTTTVSVVCRYKIVKLSNFITTIGNKNQLRKQIRDLIVTAIQVECAKNSVIENYNKLTEINESLKNTVQKKTCDWGIEIVSVLIQKIDLGDTINKGLESISVAKMDMEVNKLNAQKIFFEGSAHADVEKALQFAKAEGYKQLAKELKISEAMAIYKIDSLTQMLKNNNMNISLISSDMSDVFKMITAFNTVNTGNKKK